MRNIMNKYGFDYFMFNGYEVTIRKHSDIFAYINDIDYIYVGQQFMKLSELGQDFVLYHEIGHSKYGHNKTEPKMNKLYKIKRKIFGKLGLVVKEEILADRYAAKMLGKENALEAIYETIEMGIKTYGRPSKELKTRALLIKIFCK